jgi:hypothetical protein
MLTPTVLKAQNAGGTSTANDSPFVVEYYYKAKWGYAD